MSKTFISRIPLSGFPIWEKFKSDRRLNSFNLEITARCNNNCRHCYINLPAQDNEAKEKEISLAQIKKISEQAISLGALWCLITGGEPLLREDFFDIYLFLKQRGLLISVFTNATLITKEHINFFKKYPPRDIEVTVYGSTKETYGRVTRTPDSFAAFMRGLNLLLENNIKVRFKAMALRSNMQEFSHITEFCRERTKDFFRFDPFLHLRFDGNPEKNEEIRSERLSPKEIVAIEKTDPERFYALGKKCERLIEPKPLSFANNRIFGCGAGNGTFIVSYDGFFRLCSWLLHRDCIYDLKKYPLAEAYLNFVPQVKDMRSNNKGFLEKCRVCSLFNLCMWCPACAYLETGELDRPVEYFCKVAHARAELFNINKEYAKRI